MRCQHCAKLISDTQMGWLTHMRTKHKEEYTAYVTAVQEMPPARPQKPTEIERETSDYYQTKTIAVRLRSTKGHSKYADQPKAVRFKRRRD